MKNFSFSVVKFYARHPLFAGLAFIAYGVYFIPLSLFCAEYDWDFWLSILAFGPAFLFMTFCFFEAEKLYTGFFVISVIWSLIFAVIQFEYSIGQWLFYLVFFVITIFNTINIVRSNKLSIEESKEINKIKGR